LKQAHSHYIHVVKGVKRKMKRFVRKIEEDAPANSAGSGGIAGIGVGPQGEPGITPSRTKYKKDNALFTKKVLRRRLPQLMTGMFAGNQTFIVPESVFYEVSMARKDGKQLMEFINETSCGKSIYEYARKNPKKPVILQCEKTGSMCYAKYGSK